VLGGKRPSGYCLSPGQCMPEDVKELEEVEGEGEVLQAGGGSCY